MGASHGDFVKYPRTPHLFGSKGISSGLLSKPEGSVSIFHVSFRVSLACLLDSSGATWEHTGKVQRRWIAARIETLTSFESAAIA